MKVSDEMVEKMYDAYRFAGGQCGWRECMRAAAQVQQDAQEEQMRKALIAEISNDDWWETTQNDYYMAHSGKRYASAQEVGKLLRRRFASLFPPEPTLEDKVADYLHTHTIMVANDAYAANYAKEIIALVRGSEGK